MDVRSHGTTMMRDPTHQLVVAHLTEIPASPQPGRVRQAVAVIRWDGGRPSGGQLARELLRARSELGDSPYLADVGRHGIHHGAQHLGR